MFGRARLELLNGISDLAPKGAFLKRQKEVGQHLAAPLGIKSGGGQRQDFG